MKIKFENKAIARMFCKELIQSSVDKKVIEDGFQAALEESFVNSLKTLGYIEMTDIEVAREKFENDFGLSDNIKLSRAKNYIKHLEIALKEKQ